MYLSSTDVIRWLTVKHLTKLSAPVVDETLLLTLEEEMTGFIKSQWGSIKMTDVSVTVVSSLRVKLPGDD